MILLGIHGKARSGKDTLARLINDPHQPFQRMAFADPLKRAVAVAFNIPLDVVFSDDKDQIIQPWGVSLREILQKFGTESMRDVFGAEFWVKRWEAEYQQIKDKTNVVVTDVRFDNEARHIISQGGYIIKVEREGSGLAGPNGAHASEQGVKHDLIDYFIDNNGSLADLVDQANRIIRHIVSIK